MKRFYIEEIASNARKQLLDEGLIKPVQKGFSNEKLEKIVQSFGGKLILDDKVKSATLENISTSEFVIYYNPWYSFIYVFQELGRKLLSTSKMMDGQENKSDKVKKADVKFFMRELLMPEEEFLKVVRKYTKDGVSSAYGVARDFGVSLYVLDDRCNDLLRKGKI